VYGTPKPGTVMQIKNSPLLGNRPVWTVYDTAGDGYPGIIAVLLPDNLQGRLATSAYVSGERCFLYCPIAGEEMNMLRQDVAGTGAGEALAIGDVLMVDDGTGKVMQDSSGLRKPFVSLEVVAAGGTADVLVHCMYTGQ
jgi:hypothetical protein